AMWADDSEEREYYKIVWKRGFTAALSTVAGLENKDLTSNDAKHLLSAVASIEQIEEVAIQYFKVKYPLMDFTVEADKCEIDWWDMLQFVQHVLSCLAEQKCRCGNPSGMGNVYFEGDEELIYMCADC